MLLRQPLHQRGFNITFCGITSVFRMFHTFQERNHTCSFGSLFISEALTLHSGEPTSVFRVYPLLTSTEAHALRFLVIIESSHRARRDRTHDKQREVSARSSTLGPFTPTFTTELAQICGSIIDSMLTVELNRSHLHILLLHHRHILRYAHCRRSLFSIPRTYSLHQHMKITMTT